MKSYLLAGILMAALFACQKDKNEIMEIHQPENPDWYILTAPHSQSIRAAYGDIDGTLIITTGLKIYQTKDKGKSWTEANAKNTIALFGFTQKQDTLLAFGTKQGTKKPNEEMKYFAADPSYFSMDEGLSWSIYKTRYNRDSLRIPLDRAYSSSGIEYQIKDITAGENTYVLIGVVENSRGSQLSLPKKHYLNSIYFDAKSRVYISAEPSVCETSKGYHLCGEPQGVLYVSKQPQI